MNHQNKNRLTHFYLTFSSPLDRLAFLLVTGLGSGLLRPMPGTWGTLASLPLISLLSHIPLDFQIIFWIFLFFISTAAITHVQKNLNEKEKDLSEIVIDEILGMLLIFLWVPYSFQNFLIVFILFRFFDIIKIPPVRQIDSLSKKSKNKLLQSSGVVMDDLLAALQTLGLLWIIQKIFPILT